MSAGVYNKQHKEKELKGNGYGTKPNTGRVLQILNDQEWCHTIKGWLKDLLEKHETEYVLSLFFWLCEKYVGWKSGVFDWHTDNFKTQYRSILQLDCRSCGRPRIINLASNQKGYDTFETTVGKLPARRIQIFPVYFCLGNI